MPKVDANRWGGFKASLTRVINLAIHFTQEEITTDSIEEARSHLANMKAKYEALEVAVEDNPEWDVLSEMEAIQALYMTAKASVKKTQKLAEDATLATIHQSGDSERVNTDPKEKKVVTALQPFTLTKAHTPSDLREWREQFDRYYRSGNLGVVENSLQQGYFATCIEPSLLRAIKEGANPDTTVYGDDGLLERLEKEFEVLYPLFVRRMRLIQLKPDGEDLRSYLQRINRVSQETKFETLDRESFCVLHFAKTIEDDQLRDKVFDLPDPTYQATLKLVTSHLTKRISTKAISREQNVDQIAAFRPPTPMPRSLPSAKFKFCMRCGKNNHRSDQCKVLERGLICSNCGKKGHLSVVCQSKGQQTAKPLPMHAFQPTSTEEVHQTPSIYPEVTPRLPVEISHGNGKFTFPIFPDTGGAITMMAENLAQKYHITSDDKFLNQLPTLVTVDGRKISISGAAEIKLLNLSNNIKIPIVIVISPDIWDEIIVGFGDLRKLEVIPRGFPMSKFSTFPTSNPTNQSLNHIKEKLSDEFSDVIRDSLPNSPMEGKAMHIHLKEGAVPYKILTARKTPVHWMKEADKIVEEFIQKKIIKRVEEPTPWTAPGFWVPKANGKGIRLVVDLSRLNQYISRPVHPFPSTMDIVSNVDHNARFFAKMDAVLGFFQIPLDEESSFLTTFLIPQGRFRWLRCPMGSCASSDEWCRRSDDAIRGTDGTSKLVDDILVVARTQEELEERLRVVLQKCRKAGITLSKRKFEVGESIEFGGYKISRKGIRPDKRKLEAITAFPRPSNISKLRGFLGLSNQLINFIPDLAALTNPLRQLLRKDAAFTWLDEHTAAFETIKKTLTKSLSLNHFDPSMPTFLITDASRLNGLGFVLVQSHKGPTTPERVIQCGSRCLNRCEKNYATIELECLAMAWALEKCEFFLKGMESFKLVTDHRPLVGIFKKPLSEIANPRLVRIREKMLSFNFEVLWLEGKANAIADALSRSPLNDGEEYPLRTYIIADSDLVKDMINNAKSCPDYQTIVNSWKNDKLVKNLPPNHPGRPLLEVWKNLSMMNDSLLVVDNKRIFVPKGSRRRVLDLLHESHCGLAKTFASARERFFWPGLKNDVANVVNTCEACQIHRPSLPADKEMNTSAFYPMERVAVDLFECKNTHYLAMVDRFSGYPWIQRMRNISSEAVTDTLKGWFSFAGFPRAIRTDGGPQFRSHFKSFCNKFGIIHELASPYNPRSNGLIEVVVRILKQLLMKANKESEFEEAFTAWKNVERTSRKSPNELFFGRPVRTKLPELSTAFPLSNNNHSTENDRLRPLKIGDPVWMQDQYGKWPHKGQITSVDQRGRTYVVVLNDGRNFVRNRRFIRRRYVT